MVSRSAAGSVSGTSNVPERNAGGAAPGSVVFVGGGCSLDTLGCRRGNDVRDDTRLPWCLCHGCVFRERYSTALRRALFSCGR